MQADSNEAWSEEPAYFEFSATLRITGKNVDLAAVSHSLGLTPTHVHRAGEARRAGSSVYEKDMWMYKAPVERARPLEEHIQALWDAVRPQMSYLRSLKAQHHVDVFCGYRSNRDTAGFEVSHRCLGLFTDLEVPFGVSVIIA